MTWYPSKMSTESGGVMPEIVTWADGTDEQIVAMLEAHYNGVIDIHDYWSVGDERWITLSAMDFGAVGESQVEQSDNFVLTQVGGKYLSDGVTECAFQVDKKQSLRTAGYLKPSSSNTNNGGWRDCQRRTWCNSTFKNAFPATIQPIFKEFINQSGLGDNTTSWSGLVSTNDYFALRAQVEITGSDSYTESGEGSQVTWYQTSANRIKQLGAGYSNNAYWTRSAMKQNRVRFKYIDTNGTAQDAVPYSNYGIAPFGVI